MVVKKVCMILGGKNYDEPLDLATRLEAVEAFDFEVVFDLDRGSILSLTRCNSAGLGRELSERELKRRISNLFKF